MAVGRNGVEEGEVDDDDDDDDDRPWLGLLEKQSSFLPSSPDSVWPATEHTLLP